ncbi:MAG: hypothetical protein ACR2M0_15470 [Chloroflexia bacterium]
MTTTSDEPNAKPTAPLIQHTPDDQDPTRTPHSALRTAFYVLLILALGLGVRLASRQATEGHGIRGDEPDYVIPAQTLTRTGHYLDTFITDGRTWTRVPLNGLLLAAAFATQPQVPPAATVYDTGLMSNRFAAGEFALILVSLGLIPLVMWLAAEAFPARRRAAALLAGLITALYPPLVNSAADQLLSETLFMTLFFAALVALTRWTPRRGAWTWLVITGLLLGLASLTRSAAVAFVPFVALWLWSAVGRQPSAVNGRGFGFTLRRTASAWLVVTLVLVATIMPWTVYNYTMYGRVLWLDTSNVTAFWHYNNFRGEDETALLTALPNPADRQAMILREGLANITEYPDRFARNVLDSLGYAWHLELQSAVKPNAWDLTLRDADVPDVLPGDLAFLLISLAGLCGAAAFGGRRAADQAARVRRALLLWLVCMALLGAVVPYDARYRMPAAPALIIFASGLVVSADWRRVADLRLWAATLRAHPSVALAAGLLCAWVLAGALTPTVPGAVRAVALAWQADHTADPSQVAGLNIEAMDALPRSFWPIRHAADAARRAARDDEARRLYALAAPRGDDPRGVLGLADLAARHPDWQLTSAERDWLDADPNDLRGAPWNGFNATPLNRLTLGGNRDLGYIQGFQATEQAAGVPFRWSGGRGEIRLPASAGATPATSVRLRMAAPPLGAPGLWSVTVRVDGAAPVPVALTTAWTDYSVHLSPPVAGTLHIHLDSPVLSPHALNPASPDRRVLGAGVQRVEIVR